MIHLLNTQVKFLSLSLDVSTNFNACISVVISEKSFETFTSTFSCINEKYGN